MSRTVRSRSRSVLTARDLESFVETYKIPERFSPTLPGPDDSAECTPDRIVLYTMSFSSLVSVTRFRISSCQVWRFSVSRRFPLFCMFYKLISDGDWFTFAKRKENISQPCYSFMPTSTYPKEWKSRFIFVSAAMMPESPPLWDAKAALEDSIPVLSADEIVHWKRMYKNPTRAFTFPEGILAMGALSPSYPVRPKPFVGKKEMNLSGLLQGDCKDVQFVVGDKVEMCLSRGAEKKVTEGSVQVGDSAAEERDEEASSGEKKGPLGSLQVKSSSDYDNDEDLESRLVRKRKAAPPSSPKQVPVPRDIRLRLRSASGQKAFPVTRAASELPPLGSKVLCPSICDHPVM
ncbi:hypothetical protein Hanom_Chr12g01099581 [Helianthus anomalus]